MSSTQGGLTKENQRPTGKSRPMLLLRLQAMLPDTPRVMRPMGGTRAAADEVVPALLSSRMDLKVAKRSPATLAWIEVQVALEWNLQCRNRKAHG